MKAEKETGRLAVTKEVLVQLLVMMVGFLAGSLWPTIIWAGFLFGGEGILVEFWWSVTLTSFIGPGVMCILIAVIPINLKKKVEMLAALLTPAILMALYHYKGVSPRVAV